jgi:hypothetical protein
VGAAQRAAGRGYTKTPSLHIRADRITALSASTVERLSAHPGRTGIPIKEPKISQYKRYTAKTPVARAVDQLIEKYGGRLVLEAVADHCFQQPGLRCFARGFGQAAEQLRSRISAISALEFGRTDGYPDLDTLGPLDCIGRFGKESS